MKMHLLFNRHAHKKTLHAYLRACFRAFPLFGKTALALIRTESHWRLARAYLPFGEGGPPQILWLDRSDTHLIERLLATDSPWTFLDETEIVMGHCQIPLCKRAHLPEKISQQVISWLPKSKKEEVIAYAIWGKSQNFWSIGLFAALTSSLQQQCASQALDGYRAERCAPQSLALLAYHLSRCRNLKSALVMHVGEKSTLFMLIKGDEIALLQTVQGDLRSLETASDANRQQARQIALSLQMRFLKLFAQERADPLPPPWLLTGFRDEALWGSLDVALAPSADKEKDVIKTPAFETQAQVTPLVEGLFAMQFANRWLDANFLKHLTPPISPLRLISALTSLTALAFAVMALIFFALFARGRALQAVALGEFDHLARRIGAEQVALTNPLRDRDQRGFERNAMGFASLSPQRIQLYLKRWRAALIPKSCAMGLENLNRAVALVTHLAEPFFPQGLRIEQLLIEQSTKGQGREKDLALAWTATAPRVEMLDRFFEQIEMQLAKDFALIEIKRKGRRAVAKISLHRDLARMGHLARRGDEL